MTLAGGNLHRNLARIHVAEDYDSKFIYYFLNSNRAQAAIKLTTFGSTQALLNLSDLRSLLVPLLPLPEQRSIATALSDMDELLGGLDRLIAKKRDLKQTAMQQFLTGKTRLPEFDEGKKYKLTGSGLIPENWEALTIGDVATFSGGSQPPRYTFRFSPTQGYIRLIQIRDYKTDEFITFIQEAMARKRCTAEDIMIGRYGPPIFQILRGIDGAYNVALIKATPNQKISRDFFFHILKQEKLFQLIDSLSQRSSGQTGVEMPAMKVYGLPLPPSLNKPRSPLSFLTWIPKSLRSNNAATKPAISSKP